jgi:hypothetical protein
MTVPLFPKKLAKRGPPPKPGFTLPKHKNRRVIKRTSHPIDPIPLMHGKNNSRRRDRSVNLILKKKRISVISKAQNTQEESISPNQQPTSLSSHRTEKLPINRRQGDPPPDPA